MSPIFYLGLSSHFMTKNETLCIFFKFNFLDYIKFDVGPKQKN